MSPNELKSKLQGILAFVITPFDRDDNLDLEGLQFLVDRMICSGVNAVCCAGGVGEFYALTESEHTQVVQAVVRASAGRVPVIAGIGHATKIASVLAQSAAEAGASGLMINPMYFVDPSVNGLLAHYTAIASVSGLGMIAFSTVQFVYSVELMERLSAVPELIGVKDEVGNLNTFSACLTHFGSRFAWINGMGEVLVAPYFAAGARCFTTGLVNFAPEIPLAIYREALAGKYEMVERIVSEKARAIAQLRARKKGYSTAVLKEATGLLGFPAGACRLPLTPLEPQDRLELQAILSGIGLLSAPISPKAATQARSSAKR